MKTLGIAGVVNIGSFDPLQATVEIRPKTLDTESKGQWVTAYIELHDGYDAADIDGATVVLRCQDERIFPPKASPTAIGDHDQDGIPDLMVKFDRQKLITCLGDTTGDVTLTVSGQVAGLRFEGTDTISVIRPPESPESVKVS
jgi:hypothetical protein